MTATGAAASATGTVRVRLPGGRSAAARSTATVRLPQVRQATRKPSRRMGDSTYRQDPAASRTVQQVATTRSHGVCACVPVSTAANAMMGQCHRYIAYERTPSQRTGGRLRTLATTPRLGAAAVSAAGAAAAITRAAREHTASLTDHV